MQSYNIYTIYAIVILLKKNKIFEKISKNTYSDAVFIFYLNLGVYNNYFQRFNQYDKGL